MSAPLSCCCQVAGAAVVAAAGGTADGAATLAVGATVVKEVPASQAAVLSALPLKSDAVRWLSCQRTCGKRAFRAVDELPPRGCASVRELWINVPVL